MLVCKLVIVGAMPCPQAIRIVGRVLDVEGMLSQIFNLDLLICYLMLQVLSRSLEFPPLVVK